MAKISTYPSADNPLLLSDRLIGTEAIRPIPSSTPLATKNFSLGDLLQLFSGNFPAATLQAVLDAGNTATQNITLVGTIDTTLIKPDNIEDTSGSQGLTFQFLSKGTSSINWVDLPINNLQTVLNAGNTATQNITLIGNITSTLVIPNNIKDELGLLGITGQILSKTATGIKWINAASSTTPGLGDVLFVNNTAINNINLTGNVTATSFIKTGGTSLQYLMADGSVTTGGSIPTLQQVTTAGAITTDPITVGGITSGNLYSDGYTFGISDNYDANYNLLYQPFSDLRITDTINYVYLYQDASIGFQTAVGDGNLRSDLLTGTRSWQFPDDTGILALTSDIQILTPGQNITIVSNTIDVDIPPIVNTSAILGTTGTNPRSITIDSSGNIYVANVSLNNVTKITPTGVSTTLGTTGGSPFDITIDSLGNVYTANTTSNNVTKITSLGVSTIFGTTGSNPFNITIDSSGNIYTSNSASNNVTKITPLGVSSILGTTGSSPYGIVIDSLGNVYTANNGSNNVSKITPAGVSTIFGTTGSSPEGITIDSLGNVYTTNSGSNNVTKITPLGVSSIFASTGSFPVGITIDSSDNVYTSNVSSDNVTKITSLGVSTILGTTGDGPVDIVIDTLGNVYTVNSISNNVTKITVDNKRILAVDDNLNIIRVDGGGNGVTSVGLTMPSAFSVTNSPITSSGDIAVTGAGLVSQYVRGDGTLANFPNSTGGGSSVNYYLNGSVSQGTFGGTTYYQMSKTPILGAGTNFIRTNGAGNGYIASFITDAGDPSFLNIPGGNWNVEFYFNASSGGGSPSFYAELYKVSATNVFTLIASDSLNPEGITNGTTVDQYFTSIPVPQTSLLVTDRLAVRIFVNTGGRTITLHTENGNLSEVLTTFTTGLTALNGLTDQVQFLAVGTSGTDFAISSATDTHTFDLPTASAINRGALSSADWTTFNNKQNALSYTPYRFTAPAQIVHTGVVTETILQTILIPANTFSNGDFIMFSALVSKLANISNTSHSIKINTTNTLIGAASIAIIGFNTVNFFMKFKREFVVNGGNIYGFTTALGTPNDQATTTTTQVLNTATYNLSANLYFFVTCTLTNATDTITYRGINLYKQ